MDKCDLRTPERVSISAAMANCEDPLAISGAQGCFINHKLRYVETHAFLKNMEPSCNICLDSFAEQDNIVRLFPCAHIFCEECILKAFLISPCCPICRNYIFPHCSQIFSSFESATTAGFIECENKFCISDGSQNLSRTSIDYIKSMRLRNIPVSFSNTLLCPCPLAGTNYQDSRNFLETNNIEIQSWVCSEFEKRNYHVTESSFEEDRIMPHNENLLVSVITITLDLQKKTKNTLSQLITEMAPVRTRPSYLHLEETKSFFYSSDMINGTGGIRGCFERLLINLNHDLLYLFMMKNLPDFFDTNSPLFIRNWVSGIDGFLEFNHDYGKIKISDFFDSDNKIIDFNILKLLILQKGITVDSIPRRDNFEKSAFAYQLGKISLRGFVI